VESGRIILTRMDIDEHAGLGIEMAFQRPPAMRGIRLRDMLNICRGGLHGGDKVMEIAEIRLSQQGLSGGEIKRSKLAQLIASGY